MQIFYGFSALAKANLKNVVLTIGNFDGVHQGHRAILAMLKEKSQVVNGTTLLVVFEPQPLEYFTHKIARLYTLNDKIEALEPLVDNLLVIPFEQTIADTSAPDFVAQLCSSMQVNTIFIGDDFHFGKNRQGNFILLQTLAGKYDYQVAVIPTIRVTQSQTRISSTYIRELLANNQLAKANSLLALPFSFTGVVEKGRQLARNLNAPTANMPINRKASPLHGTYACLVQVAGELLWRQGVCNVGFKPTLSDNNAHWVVETHIFDFQQDLYGKELKVVPVVFLRSETKFANLDELKDQIAKDLETAKQLELIDTTGKINFVDA